MAATLTYDCRNQANGDEQALERATDRPVSDQHDVQAYLDRGATKDAAVFELFARNLPPRRGFLVAAGLEQALQYLETLEISPAEIEWLKSTGCFRPNLIDYLSSLRFTGDVHAMPEGDVFFANEPILRVTAPRRRRSSSNRG